MNLKKLRAKLSEQTTAQNNNNLVDRRLARRVGADYNSVRAAMLRLQRNPNPKLLPAKLLQHYNTYMSASVQAATMAAKAGGARYFAESAIQDPPMVLVLKRKGVRLYPDGKRIALYSNDKLGIAFSVPYTAGKVEQPAGAAVAEEIEEIQLSAENIDENIEHIKDIVDKHQAKKLKFLDGSSMSVDATTAKAIHLVHGALNDENKAKVARMLSHSKGQFMKVADFAMKNTAFKIDK